MTAITKRIDAKMTSSVSSCENVNRTRMLDGSAYQPNGGKHNERDTEAPMINCSRRGRAVYTVLGWLEGTVSRSGRRRCR